MITIAMPSIRKQYKRRRYIKRSLVEQSYRSHVVSVL
jgi:hypothetical protein